MDLLIKPCLIEEDFATAAVIEESDHFRDNFQLDGFHVFSPSLRNCNTPALGISNRIFLHPTPFLPLPRDCVVIMIEGSFRRIRQSGSSADFTELGMLPAGKSTHPLSSEELIRCAEYFHL